MVGDHLIEGSVAVPEIGRREVDHQLGLGSELVEDLEVQHRLALRFLGRPPVGVAFDGDVGVEGREPELGRELVEVVEVRQVVDLGQQDGLAASIEPGISQWLQVVKGEDVRRRESAVANGQDVRPSIVVEAAHAARSGRQLRRDIRLLERRVERGAIGKAEALDVDLEQR